MGADSHPGRDSASGFNQEGERGCSKISSRARDVSILGEEDPKKKIGETCDSPSEKKTAQAEKVHPKKTIHPAVIRRVMGQKAGKRREWEKLKNKEKTNTGGGRGEVRDGIWTSFSNGGAAER